ncbi:sensor histidine kinase [Paenibacillus solisilvae]|uniref:Sensor histidine kinase n=1 Tax=Paenibacillus solisilvae TaxID=2486751 RepID=A0ABW0VVB3_9BACL
MKENAKHLNTFHKVNLIIFLLLIPINILYWFSNQASIDVVKSVQKQSGLNQMIYLVNQLDGNVNQLSKVLVTLSSDPNIIDFAYLERLKSFEQMELANTIERKLMLQSVSSPFTNHLSAYSISAKQAVGTYPQAEFNSLDLLDSLSEAWKFKRNTGIGEDWQYYFERFLFSPYSRGNQLDDTNIILRASFSPENIRKMINEYTNGQQTEAYFYSQGHAPIMGQTADKTMVEQLTSILKAKSIPDAGSQIIKLQNGKYVVHYVKSKTLRWYMIGYTPLDHVLEPITRNRDLFYLSIFLLLVTGIAASFMLYRNVQLPIKRLIWGVSQLKQGNYAVRIHGKSKNEFDFLIGSFNDMAEQIEELIENVYKEKLHSREATLKQLQSQINPHFLYNCLFFIQNMSRSGNDEAVEAMALSLAEFFRYTTRVDKRTAPLRDELKLITNYLVIQELRMKRLQYTIDISEEMLDLELPCLFLQPFVENSALHGFEMKNGPCMIIITGTIHNEEKKIVIEDNGKGLTQEQIEQLNEKIRMPLNKDMGYAIWNVYQRLVWEFGDSADILFSSSELGGIRAEIHWK